MTLEIKNLSVEYYRDKKIIPALKNFNLNLRDGEGLGLVGESGSGKSTAALSILRLIQPHEGRITKGEIIFNGRNLLILSEEEMRQIRGKDIGIVFQDPFGSLNPVLRIGEQIEESASAHSAGFSRSQLKDKALEALSAVSVPEPERIYNSFPHQISGGQRQRAMIAMAIMNRPQLLIADEPTTALDVTVQKEILDLLASLRKDLNMGLILITHHLGIVSHLAENLQILFRGETVESGPSKSVLTAPRHEYTRTLLEAVPKGTRHA